MKPNETIQEEKMETCNLTTNDRKNTWPTVSASAEMPENLSLTRDLLIAFEEVVEDRPDDPAIYLRDPRSRNGEACYLSLSFNDLRTERDAWAQRLVRLGIESSDRVLIWLPKGLAMTASAYALLKIGAEVGISEESNSNVSAIQGFKPTVVIASSTVVKSCKKHFDDNVQILEIQSPLMRVASAVSSSRPRPAVVGGMSSPVTFFEEIRGKASPRSSFAAAQISSMLGVYPAALCIEEGELDSPDHCSMSLLNPAMGVASAFTQAGFGNDSGNSVERVFEAVADLRISRLTRSLEEWEELMALMERKRARLPELKRVFISGDLMKVSGAIERFRVNFPDADFFVVLGSSTTPVAAVRKIDDGEFAENHSAKGLKIGKLLPGLRPEILLPKHSDESNEVPSLSRDVGELKIFDAFQVAEMGLEEKKSKSSGYFASEDDDGTLWLRGRVSDAVHSSFGVFLPARCEPVFEMHRHVTRALLIELNSKTGLRPAVVVEVEEGKLPKDAISESKMKAELLQLGAGISDTKMILDFFFLEATEGREPKIKADDREKLSRRYSLLSKVKTLF